MENTEPRKNYWFYTSPNVCFGAGALEYLEDIPGKKVLIVTDEFIEKNLLHLVTDKLVEYKKKYKVFAEVLPDPPEEVVMDGVKICNRYKPDLIIAVGGGSSIDTAKTIWILYEHPDITRGEIYPYNGLGISSKAKMVAIPTTSGTGAEASWAMVITHKQKDNSEIKLELANKEAIPNYAILDPIFTMGMPPKITADTGLDAISHAIDGLLARFKNVFSDAQCEKAYELLREFLPIAYRDGKNIEARTMVHNAACMAGLGFANSQTILTHAIGHALGAVYHIPHGYCVGSALIATLQYLTNNKEVDRDTKILSNLARKMGMVDHSVDDDVALSALIQDLRKIMHSIGFPRSLSESAISEEEFNSNINEVVKLTMESVCYTMSIRVPTGEELTKILKYMWEGKDVDF